jgi:hypothetical protein
VQPARAIAINAKHVHNETRKAIRKPTSRTNPLSSDGMTSREIGEKLRWPPNVSCPRLGFGCWFLGPGLGFDSIENSK